MGDDIDPRASFAVAMQLAAEISALGLAEGVIAPDRGAFTIHGTGRRVGPREVEAVAHAVAALMDVLVDQTAKEAMRGVLDLHPLRTPENDTPQ